MAFTERLDVFLHGARVGVISTQGTTCVFEFLDAYFDDPQRRMFSMRFEEDNRRSWYADGRLPNWFGHLLPEGRLREMIIRDLGLDGRQGSRLATEIDLISAVGADLPGAVQVFPAAEPRDARPPRTPPRAVDDRPTVSGDDGSLRFSAVAGVGLKFSMLRSGHQFVLPAHDGRGHWLVKMPAPGRPHLPVNEYAVMSLARRCGIDVPDIDLVHRDAVRQPPDHMWSGEDHAFVIRRFDRHDDGRVHIEDLAQVRDVPPGDDGKYRGNYETIGGYLYRGQDEASFLEFVRRLAFSLLVGNADAHLKNWSLIYRDGRRATISPAYDLVSVVAYTSLGIDTSLALRIGNRRRFDDVNLASFQRLGNKVGSGLDVGDVVRDTSRLVMSGLDQLCDDLAALPATMRNAVATHVRDMSARLR